MRLPPVIHPNRIKELVIEPSFNSQSWQGPNNGCGVLIIIPYPITASHRVVVSQLVRCPTEQVHSRRLFQSRLFTYTAINAYCSWFGVAEQFDWLPPAWFEQKLFFYRCWLVNPAAGIRGEAIAIVISVQQFSVQRRIITRITNLSFDCCCPFVAVVCSWWTWIELNWVEVKFISRFSAETMNLLIVGNAVDGGGAA